MAKIPFIVAGASRRGEYLAQLMQETGQAELTGLVDIVPAKAAWLKETHGWQPCAIFSSIEEALATVPSEAVVVATSDANHAEVAVPALNAGKFVFCEKPLETTCEKLRAIIDADARSGGRTFVGLNLRYAPVYATMKREIERGAIGDVLTLQADEFYEGGRTYFRRWNRLRSCGGLWLSKATHDFDLLYWLSGKAAPQEAFTVAARSYYAPRADAADCCRACTLHDCPDRAPEPDQLNRLTEAATGIPYDLCLFNSGGGSFDHGMTTIRHEGDIFSTYTCSVVSGFTERRMRISGTRGTLDGVLSSDRLILQRRQPSERVEIPVTGAGDEGHGGADVFLASEFIAFIQGTGQPRSRPLEAAQSARIGLAANLSEDEHRMVRMDEVAL